MHLAHQTTIKDLLERNPSYAAILHFFGIQFFNHEEHTLEEACREYGILPEIVEKKLEEHQGLPLMDKDVDDFPVDLVVAYLKHVHQHFLKYKLPFLFDLVENMDVRTASEPTVVSDLKLIFPVFVEDFIKHIYDEEDTVFRYIELLHQATLDENKVYLAVHAMESQSIAKFAADHEHEDEMEGIRKLTDDYKLGQRASLNERILYSELCLFDQQQVLHGNIEDNILFKKAQILEQEIYQRFTASK